MRPTDRRPRGLRATGAVGLAAAVLALASPGVLGAGSARPGGRGAVAAENSLPGTRSWYIAHPRPSAIAAFTDSPSYLPGQAVHLFVGSHDGAISYAVYRMGWYGGRGGRLMLAGKAPGVEQPPPHIVDDSPGGAKLLLLDWSSRTSFRIPRRWVSGFYLIRLRRTRGGAQSYASFVLRSRSPGAIVVSLATTTWQAYNTWGGLSLYRDLRLPRRDQFDRTRVAHEVSSRRPYIQGYGAGDFFRYDRPLLEWLERAGYPVTYATDLDASRGRLTGKHTRVVVVSGHAEYQDAAARAYYTRMLKRGVSLALLGGNDFAWHARLRADDQIIGVWRTRKLDPRPGADATIRWTALGHPPSQLSGVMPVLGRPGALHVVGGNSWPWDAVPEGTPLGRVLGGEYDGKSTDSPNPAGLRVLAEARVPGARRGVTWTIATPTPASFVFSGSELGFNWQLARPQLTSPAWIDASAPPGSARDYPRRSVVERRVQRLVAALLRRALVVQ
ncbi:MAG: hypothetical protein M3Q31_26580 [Actinomycetota bacterium]|nr:hypothetical protein [Actinomycetota bacterium]